ncbi:hypothetical protein CBM2586_A50175 [Cupriavidus phytorum]|uniref:Uncharacterized protein n=1 Tax=Cupriavidus taiwanensis TaxID=164546 RepID=A0A975X7P8_9BURK|nr:hypothetical protein CBM2586_A50175 [Cupriavidus taiwanensis]
MPSLRTGDPCPAIASHSPHHN